MPERPGGAQSATPRRRRPWLRARPRRWRRIRAPRRPRDRRRGRRPSGRLRTHAKSSARPSDNSHTRSRTAATSWNRRRSRPVACRRPEPSPGATSACTSTARARLPDRGNAVAAPGTTAWLTSRSVGSTSVRPSGRISNQADSPSAPNRFLLAPSTRIPERWSPPNANTTSTACSSARGPARSPSLVTWPVIITATPSDLARPTRASVQVRTCATPPGICAPAASRSVWMESTARTNGADAAVISSTAPRSRPGANAMASPPMPRRRARAATWA